MAAACSTVSVAGSVVVGGVLAFAIWAMICSVVQISNGIKRQKSLLHRCSEVPKQTSSERRHVSQAQARKWRSEMDRGTTATAIASRERLDPRTVRTHVARARRKGATAEARGDLLRDALRAHQADLSKLVAGLARRVAQSEPPTPFRAGEGLPVDAVTDHLGHSPVGKALARWLDYAAEFPTLLPPLLDRVDADPEVAAFTARSGIPDGISVAARAVAAGTDVLGLDVVVEGRIVKHGYEFPIAVFPSYAEASASGALVTEYDHLLRGMEDWPEMAATSACREGAWKVAQVLRDDLNVLRLRRYILGDCRYCPDMEGL
jgi:hypothetical protein